MLLRAISLALAATLVGCATQTLTLTPAQSAPAVAPAATSSPYVQAVMSDAPVAVLQGVNDLTGTGPAGTAIGQPAAAALPNGDMAQVFNGTNQYLEFADREAFEVDATGILTVEFWMRPDTLQFSDEEGSGYVYTMGKGDPGSHEWYTRMYSESNAESRPNRISGYTFNPAGGLGAGSYFQDTVKTGEWIHVALVINTVARSAQYPSGYSRIYKNGVLRDTDSLKDYNIVPQSGNSPLRIGTGYLGSHFKGAIGDVAFYDKELGAAQLDAHHEAMSAPATPAPVPPSPTPAVEPSHPTLTNVARRVDKLVRYTPRFGRSTRTRDFGLEATVVGHKITRVRNRKGNSAIPSNGYVLSGRGESRRWLRQYAKTGSKVAVARGVVTISAPTARTTRSVKARRSAYVRKVLRDRPAAFLQGLNDRVGRGKPGVKVGRPTSTRLPDGSPAWVFNGKDQHVQFADRAAFEVDATGILTVEFWMRPDTLQFSDEEGSGYVYTMGKGDPGSHEWYTRMYSESNAESRPNRISGYAFNPAGGLGAGSYFQDTVKTGEWIHVALVINTVARSAQYPSGYSRIYKNGVLRDTDSLKDYNIVPQSGNSPLRIGTGYLGSHFKGAIGNVAFYPREVSAARLGAHHRAGR